jgi:hypothetical protein
MITFDTTSGRQHTIDKICTRLREIEERLRRSQGDWHGATRPMTSRRRRPPQLTFGRELEERCGNVLAPC